MRWMSLLTVLLLLALPGAVRGQLPPDPPPALPAPPGAVPPGYDGATYPPPELIPVVDREVCMREAHPSVVYGELLGKGLVYSVGFDHNIRRWLGVGASFAYVSPAVHISPYVNLYPVGGRSSALLIQTGLQVVHISDNTSELHGNLLWPSGEGEQSKRGFDFGGQTSIGYEYRSGFLFRVAVLLMYNAEGVMPWPGLTFGGAF